MFDYGIGGQEVPKEASEGMADIPMNRTLMIEKLTADAPVKPQVVDGLKNVDEVFANFKPQIDVEYLKEDGSEQKEQLNFKNLGDFGAKGITNQSAFLKDLEMQKNEYSKVIKQLKSNKVLKTVLENPEMKAAFLTALQAMAQEIEDAK
ncbi:MAG TPA: type VI secretion system contractile sheath small subunit [Bacteroidia bacterium]|nr:type VI secretion system contractile sheath small subunit [Bacteroidia bacterium]